MPADEHWNIKEYEIQFFGPVVCTAWISTNDDQTLGWQDQAGVGFWLARTCIPALFEIHDGVKAPGFN